MKSAWLLSALLASSLSMAGTLTIIPDSTSSMGIAKQQRDAALKARTERQARIAAGLEQPPQVIIIKQRPASLNCYSYGDRNQFTNCQQY